MWIETRSYLGQALEETRFLLLLRDSEFLSPCMPNRISFPLCSFKLEMARLPPGSWEGSDVNKKDIEWLIRSRRVGPQVICWLAGKEEIPTPQAGERVVFLTHFERGFGLPASEFFRSFLDSSASSRITFPQTPSSPFPPSRHSLKAIWVSSPPSRCGQNSFISGSKPFRVQIPSPWCPVDR